MRKLLVTLLAAGLCLTGVHAQETENTDGSVDVYKRQELAKLVDYEIAYPVNEQLKFFMVADRFMQNHGEFDDCDEMYAEYEKHLAQALIEVEKKADAFGQEFAKKHWNDPIHYFVGDGNQWGATYSLSLIHI